MASATLNYLIPYPENTDSVDVAGDIQSLAEHLDNNLSEIIADNVGLMVSSNTESGVSVLYNDIDNTLDFIASNFDIELIGAVSGSATVSQLSNIAITTQARDFDIYITGHVSASATVDNLSNVNLVAEVENDSHVHTPETISNLNLEDLSDISLSSPQEAEQIYYNFDTGFWENGPTNKKIFISEISQNLTIAVEDSGKMIALTSSSATQVTIPSSSAVFFPPGYRMSFLRYGPGSVTFVPNANVTLHSKSGYRSISSQYCTVDLINISNNTWLLTGDLS